MNLEGAGKLEVLVEPNGSVKDRHVIARAVKQWGYVSTGRETTEQ